MEPTPRPAINCDQKGRVRKGRKVLMRNLKIRLRNTLSRKGRLGRQNQVPSIQHPDSGGRSLLLKVQKIKEVMMPGTCHFFLYFPLLVTKTDHITITVGLLMVFGLCC